MGQKWIQSHSGTSDVLKTLMSSGLPWASSPSHLSSEQGASLESDGTPVELPDRFVTEACIAFCKCGKVGLIYPIADMSLLEDSVKTAYSPPSEENPQALSIAKALVLSFVAFCTAADRREHMLYPVDGELCAFEAESLLSTVHDPAHSIGKLQVLLLLVSVPGQCALKHLLGISLSTNNILVTRANHREASISLLAGKIRAGKRVNEVCRSLSKRFIFNYEAH